MSKIADALRKIQKQRLAGQRDVIEGEMLGNLESDNAGSSRKFESTIIGSSTRFVKVNRMALRAAGLLGSELDEDKLAEEYRQIKRPIITNTRKENDDADDRHLVLIASAHAGDGKTFTCMNLALSVAREQDISAILIDGDVTKRQVSTLFDLDDEPGLLDYLENSNIGLEDILLNTDVPGFGLIPAGRPRPNATELLASERMKNLIKDLRDNASNCLVFVDSSPLLLTTESRILADAAGQIVLVVRAGVTPQAAVLDAIEFLKKELPINLVLNECRQRETSIYYGGYHSYGSATGTKVDQNN